MSAPKQLERHGSPKFKLSSAEIILSLRNINKTATKPSTVWWLVVIFWQGEKGGKAGVEWKTKRNNILLKMNFVKVFLLRFEISLLQLLPTYLMKGKKKALPAHINEIKEQYKSSSVKPVLSQQITDSRIAQ